MKKALFLLTAAILIFTAVSCAEEPEAIPEYGDNELSSDFTGMTFSYLMDVSDWYIGESFGYMEDSIFGEKAMERKSEVEDKYSVKINTVYETNSVTSYSQAGVMAGLTTYDAMQAQDTELNGAMRAGYLLPISLVSDIIDPLRTDLWGEPCYLEGIAWIDDLYGVIPASWPELTASYCGYPIAFNIELASTYNIGDPRQYLEDGTWNKDTFMYLMETYTRKDGEKEIKGLSAHNYHFAEMAVYSVTEAMAYKTDKTDSGWISTMHTEAVVDALEWIRDMFFGQYKEYVINAAGYIAAAQDMLDGNSVMSMSYLGYFFSTSSAIANEMKEIGLMPFPLGNNMENGEYISCIDWVNYCISFPVNVADPEFAATMIYELYQPLDGLETQNEIDDFFNRYVFYNESDYNIYKTVSRNTRYTFFSEGARNIIELVTGSDGKTISECLQSGSDAQQQIVDKYIAPAYEAIEAVYGIEYPEFTK